jgi:hypothetical protein
MRRRLDKPAGEADTLSDLQAVLEAHRGQARHEDDEEAW